MTDTLAPLLGRFAAPAGRGRFDVLRMELLDQLFTANARRELTGSVWLSAWVTAMTQLRDAVLTESRSALSAAAAESRYPVKRLQALLPDAESADHLYQRLLAKGVELERLETDPDPASQRRRGAVLESGWAAAVREAELDLNRWRAVANEVAQWRRPWRPLILGLLPLLALATLLGCWIGGILPAPDWFQPVTDQFWSFPWPL